MDCIDFNKLNEMIKNRKTNLDYMIIEVNLNKIYGEIDPYLFIHHCIKYNYEDIFYWLEQISNQVFYVHYLQLFIRGDTDVINRLLEWRRYPYFQINKKGFNKDAKLFKQPSLNKLVKLIIENKDRKEFIELIHFLKDSNIKLDQDSLNYINQNKEYKNIFFRINIFKL